jgi:hypothetical protein
MWKAGATSFQTSIFSGRSRRSFSTRSTSHLLGIGKREPKRYGMPMGVPKPKWKLPRFARSDAGQGDPGRSYEEARRLRAKLLDAASSDSTVFADVWDRIVADGLKSDESLRRIEEILDRRDESRSFRSGQEDLLIERFHTLIDLKLLGKLTPEQSVELSGVQSGIREMQSARRPSQVRAADSLRIDHQELQDAIQRVNETLTAIQRRKS